MERYEKLIQFHVLLHLVKAMEKRLLLSVKLYEENNKLNAERVCAFFLKTTKT